MPTASTLRIAWVAPASPMGTQAEVEQAKQWVEARYPCRIVYTPACYQSQSIEEVIYQDGVKHYIGIH